MNDSETLYWEGAGFYASRRLPTDELETRRIPGDWEWPEVLAVSNQLGYGCPRWLEILEHRSGRRIIKTETE